MSKEDNWNLDAISRNIDINKIIFNGLIVSSFTCVYY
jgi:hypothetical protein